MLIIDRKQNVSSAAEQLQELEAKLRETEQRLARVSRQSSPSRQANTAVPRSHAEPQQQQQAMSGAMGSGKSPLAQKPTYPEDRPPTGGRPQNVRGETETLMAGMPGGLPQTPVQHNGSEYVMVDRGDERGERGFGRPVG